MVFDIGGVLARISNTWQLAAGVAGVGTRLSPEPSIPLEGLAGFLEYQVGAWEEPRYLAALATQLGVTEAEALRIHNGILIEPYPSTLDLVEELEANDVMTGVLSNTNRPHWEILTDPSLYPAIARIERKVPSHEIRLEKPDPRIFLYYTELYGYMPRQVVFFDDNARNTASALATGWRAHLIDPLGDPVSQMREILVSEGVLPASIDR